MRAWGIADLRWASRRELSLPLWDGARGADDWHERYVASALPRQRAGDLYVAAARLESAEDPIARLRDALSAARWRVVATVAVGEEGQALPHARLRELEALIGEPLPPLPADALASGRLRTLGFVLDARGERRSVGILVPHWESWQFLEPCVEAITTQRNPRVDQRVYVLDDHSTDGSFETASEAYADRDDVQVLRIDRPNRASVADVGLLLDIGLKHVEEQYVASIDADLFPLSQDWLAFPVWLLERYRCSAVGLDTGLSSSYAQRDPAGTWWQPPDGYVPAGGLYDNEWFVCINNLYRVMPTALAKVASEHVGFRRRTAPTPFALKALRRLGRDVPSVAPAVARATSGRSPYITHDADNGVAANHFLDVNRLGPKFNIPITSYLGLTPTDGAFGQNIAGLAFHFALSTRALSRERREVERPGPEFERWARRLAEAGGIDRETLGEMIADSAIARPGGADGSIPASWYEGEFEHMNRLLAQYRAATGQRR